MEQITMVPLEQLHPHEKNPRIDAAQVEDLTESIREHGIEVPLVAAPAAGADGYVVLAGHRRLTAAHALGLTEAPVQIREDLTDPKAQLAFMATENILRDQLTAVEESRLVQDMLDLGMTQAQVAKQTALGKKRVSERVKLGKLAENTGDKVHRGQITVDDALVIAEYADDPKAVEQLEEHAGTYNFDWAVSRAKQRRETAQMIADARKSAKKQGVRIVEEDTDFLDVRELITEGWATPALEAAAAEEISDDAWDELIIAEHKDCPGHSVRIIEYGTYRGELEYGCDQVATQHAGATHTEEPDTDPEPEHDPWDDITAEDLDTARIHREQHLAKVLPNLDVTTEVKADTIRGILGYIWTGYGDPAPSNLSLIQGLTEVKGKDKTARVLDSWDLPALLWLRTNWWDLTRAHYSMSIGRQGSSYWSTKSKLRMVLEHTDYPWSEPEQQAILLATGIPHDATDDDSTEDGAALAEGGDAA